MPPITGGKGNGEGIEKGYTRIFPCFTLLYVAP